MGICDRGIGERITWTSGFDGLGRLIARELDRPLRLDEAPTCDFALDEAIVLADRELKKPLVHLRIKQAKVVSVSLFAGVNIAIPIVDTATIEATSRGAREPKQGIAAEELTDSNKNLLGSLAEVLWPYLRPFVIDETTQRFAAKRRRKAGSRGTTRKGKSEAGSQLSLKDGSK